MNLLYTNATSIFAGGEDYVLTLAREMKRRGHTVLISANPGHLLLEKSEASGIPTVPIAYGDMKRVMHVGSLIREAIRTHGVDVVHSNANYDRTCAAIGALRTQARHVASVHSSHSIQHNVTHWLRNRYGIDHFIAVSDNVARILEHEDGIPEKKITFVPNAVETVAHEFRDAAREKTRTQWSISPGTVVIGNVARLTEFKGHKYLLQSIAQVVKEEPDVFFPILGDGELMDELQRQARTLGLEQHVRLFGFLDNIEELYPAFDIYCHSSIELGAEAFPIAILRALATGLPCVCTSVGGIRLMVEDGVNGRLTPPERPELLANALLELIRDPLKRETMGKASLKLFTEKYHITTMGDTVEKIYRSLIRK